MIFIQSDIPIYVFYSWPAVEITVAAHDTTGGMVTKISEAALIAKLGIDVYIVKVIESFQPGLCLICCHCILFSPVIYHYYFWLNTGSNNPLIKGCEWRGERRYS